MLIKCDTNRYDKEMQDTYYAERRARYARRKHIRHIQRNIRLVSITAVFVLILGLSLNALNAQATTPEEAAKQEYKYYTSIQISNGDNLWSIASSYTDGSTKAINNCISEIRSINHLGENEAIKSGEFIIVPYYSTDIK